MASITAAFSSRCSNIHCVRRSTGPSANGLSGLWLGPAAKPSIEIAMSHVTLVISVLSFSGSGRSDRRRLDEVAAGGAFSTSAGKEGDEELAELAGRLLGDEVPAGHRRRREVVGPRPPDVPRVGELGLVGSGDDEHGGCDPPPGGPVLGIVAAVEVEARAVVGAHGGDRR